MEVQSVVQLHVLQPSELGEKVLVVYRSTESLYAFLQKISPALSPSRLHFGQPGDTVPPSVVPAYFQKRTDDFSSAMRKVLDYQHDCLHRSAERHSLTVFVRNLQELKKNTQYQELLFNGRNLNLVSYTLQREVPSLPPSIRDEYDTIVIFGDVPPTAVYRKVVPSVTVHLRELTNILDACAEGNRVFVIKKFAKEHLNYLQL